MLDCRQVLTELSNYLDGDVSLDLKHALDDHLAQCSRCSLIYSTTQKTLKIVTESGALDLPLHVSARLHERLRVLFPTGQ